MTLGTGRVCSVLVALALAVAVPQAHAGDLRVKDGKFELSDGKPFRGVGVNYFDAINRSIKNPKDVSALTGLGVLSHYEVPFVRVMLGGYWPSEMRLYETDHKQYFEILDRFVKTAEENRIGIVASLAWNYATIPDIVGEPASAWGRKDSKTLTWFQRYVSEVVERYKGSSAIWMWEFGNEMALNVDLPNASQWRPAVDASKGTANRRSDADDLTAAMQAFAMGEFSRWVRAIDPHTPLSTGNALPRPFAYNNRMDRGWRADTREQFCEMLVRDNPRGFDVISIHIYPKKTGYFGRAEHDASEVLGEVSQCAKPAGKPVFAGEFGVSDAAPLPVGQTPRVAFTNLLSALERHQIGLSAAWVFDFAFHESSINITPNNERAYMLDAIRDVNRRLRSGR